MAGSQPFRESGILAKPIRDLGLAIEGTWLGPVIDEFRREISRAGIHRLVPRFYLSNEWGVSDSLAIGIPFYLARPDLMALQAERVGHVEGATRADILRYLRHELGHVVCYAYRLHEEEEWVEQFGSATQPCPEEYRVEPFSRRYVRHLPGWYAQKHPEEDWCETEAELRERLARAEDEADEKSESASDLADHDTWRETEDRGQKTEDGFRKTEDR